MESAETMNTQLEITRRPHFVGLALGARIRLDGRQVANVGNGKTVTLEVSPGKHVVDAWLGGNPSGQCTIDFIPGKTVYLECRMKPGCFASAFELISYENRSIVKAPLRAGGRGATILISAIVGLIFGTAFAPLVSRAIDKAVESILRSNGPVQSSIQLRVNHS
jgi:hypothetical protein